jgi:hypothetical protein
MEVVVVSADAGFAVDVVVGSVVVVVDVVVVVVVVVVVLTTALAGAMLKPWDWPVEALYVALTATVASSVQVPVPTN